jgi:O-antigen/teichoic acid export membrane protein
LSAVATYPGADGDTASAPPAAGRGALVLAIADQVVVSGTRFVVGWLLARRASPEQYGAYVLGFSAILILEIVPAALITWPLAVSGAQKTEAELGAFVTRIALLEAVLSATLSLGLWTAASLVPGAWISDPVRLAFQAAAVASLFLQGQELCRRVMLTRSRMGAALANDVLLAGAQIAGVLLLAFRGRLDAPHALLAIAASAALAFVAGVGQIRSVWQRVSGGFAEVARENWEFGRWVLGSRIGEGLLNHASNFVVAALAGLAGTAALEAPRLLLAPVQVVSFGWMNFMLPRGAMTLAAEGPAALVRFVDRAAAVSGAVFLAFGLAVAAAPELCLRLLYAGRYQEPLVLRLWAASYVLLGIRVILSTTLYVMRRSDLMMVAVLACGAGSLALTAALSRPLGPTGAVSARLLGEAALLVAVARLGSRRRMTAAGAGRRP